MSGDSYLVITVHGISQEWTLHHFMLTVLHVAERHTGTRISVSIDETMKEWNINENQVVAATTDRGANMVKAIQLLGHQHIPCLAHVIHIGVVKHVSNYGTFQC